MLRARLTVIAVALSTAYGLSEAALTDLSNEPLATGLSAVPPNVMFVLDDSGSMGSDFTPDHVSAEVHCRNTFVDIRIGNTDSPGGTSAADGKDDRSDLVACAVGDPPFASPQFNFQYYNPGIYYEPPYHPNDRPNDVPPVITYPSQNSANTTAWTVVKNNPFVSASTTNLRQRYTDVRACNVAAPTTAQLFNPAVCVDPVEAGVYKYPNPSYNSTVQTGLFPFRVQRTGTTTAGQEVAPYFYTIDSVVWCRNRNTTVIANGRAASKFKFGKGTTNTASPAFATNPCNVRKGTFGGINYQFVKYGTVAHATTNDTANQNSQIGPTDDEGITGFTRINIVETAAGSNTLPAGYPPKGIRRIDCAGPQCTYQEEMTNFANWYSYYRTRMQAMKTAAGLAFKPKSSELRVGFITINPGSPVSSGKYLKLQEFGAAEKIAWYNKFYSQTPGPTTPLRQALSRVGRHFAGKTDSINAGMPDDPIIASCQQNFAILTTDGYWNGSGGVKLDGATAMGDEDDNIATAPRPFYDGANAAPGPGTASGTLADVAFYYYVNDLRPAGSKNAAGVDVSTNNVPTNTRDTAPHQHMTTFTLGLGIEGRLQYDPAYETQTTGDFASIKAGLLDWPKPAANQDVAVDDLWHAAVNGRGKYFSARDPQLLSDGLKESLNEVNARIGAGAAAATSSLKPVAGDNLAFTAQYETQKWHGDLTAKTIDTDATSATFGQVSSRVLWSAQALLDATNWSSRRILMFDPGAGVTKIKDFCWPGSAGCVTGLNATEQSYFKEALPATGIKQINQYPNWAAAQRANATSLRLVDYLRGDFTYQDSGIGIATDLFRKREHKLGDITNSKPIFIKKPPFDYSDDFYKDFKSVQATRKGVVVVGANDGMLHAFQTDPDGNPYFQTAGFATADGSDDAFTGTNDGGVESWAYVPGAVLPNLYKLAENNPFHHQFLVDGSPVVADVCSGSCTAIGDWKTILVAGLNKGGRGYYALDITDPLNPAALWEFTASATCATDADITAGSASSDCNIGYSFGQPVITKQRSSVVGNNGKWVVLVTSGYNNVSPGDGKGYLYMIDAFSGKIMARIGTTVGDVTDPSGLGKINAFVNRPLNATLVTNNTADLVFGGDLLGNLWRFDISGSPGSYKVDKLATLTSLESPPKAQPITARPEIGIVVKSTSDDKGVRVVFVGSGRYLGASDVADTSVQTIYGIKDSNDKNDLTFQGLVDVGTLVQHTMGSENSLADGTIVRSVTGPGVNFKDDPSKGFRIDLPAGERVNVDLELQVGTLVAPSNLPETDVCSAGGIGWLNNIDYETGLSVPITEKGGSFKFSSGLIVGTTVVQLPGGKTVTITTTADTKQTTREVTGSGGSSASISGKRTAWRELIVE
jgi:type IV pilus assembly protein PilY1